MRYFGKLRKKWVETDILFAAAFLSSIFLLFIVLEPFISSLFSPIKVQSDSVIQINLGNGGGYPESNGQLSNQVLKTKESDSEHLLVNSPKKKNSHPASEIDVTNIATNTPSQAQEIYEANSGASTPLNTQQSIQYQSPSWPEGTTFKTNPTDNADAANPSALSPTYPNIQAQNLPPPEIFSFGTAANSPNLGSPPFLGVNGGFHSGARKLPNPQKNLDTASNKALEIYRDQMGQEFERRQAQAELIQLVNSLNEVEKYQCFIQKKDTSKSRDKNQTSSEQIKCLPSNPKAAFMEWIIKRLYPEQTCMSMTLSRTDGLKEKRCKP